MAKYLVRFTDKKYYPDFSDLSKYIIKLGTLHHYRNIEDKVRRDQNEGQKGLDLILKRPCKKLDELRAKEGSFFPHIDENNYKENGEFKAEFHILAHDHLYDFNAWVFCCSVIDDLDLIPELEKHFECDSHYFITDIDLFVNQMQKSLAANLVQNPTDEQGKKRMRFGNEKKIYLDGYKDIVKYNNDSKSMEYTYETLTDFMNSKYSREVNQKYWFQKSKRFEIEREFRVIFFPTTNRTEGKRFTITDNSIFLECNLNNCVSIEPKFYDE